MNSKFSTQNHLKISTKDIRTFNNNYIEHGLGFINRIMNTCVYMIDYRTKRIIFGNVSNPTICGYSREVFKQEGFNIYKKILSEDEMLWLTKMNEDACRIFYSYSNFEDRMGVEFSYDLTAIAKNGKQVSLYQRIVPYRLCENGNIWLALCAASTKPFTPNETKARIDNYVTGDSYNYVKEKFVFVEQKHLTEDEVLIIKCLAEGIRMKDIGNELGIKQRTVEQKARSAFDKLEVATQGAAVCRAKDRGLI
ncbi:MAG: helix-turn-helix transcriptional regulator [Bacteroidales bacterium]|jgi:DNA-binding CsgD family transcriptional regulator|nr:helix-turn-helix transcriptional regulator [Bacteroidales bacterium]